MSFSLTILGANSAQPAYGRHPTAQIISLKNRNFLVDCGEGTQIQLSKYHIKRSKIDHIFISHLHGDHFWGLFPLLDSMMLAGRKKTLHLYAPAGIWEFKKLYRQLSGNFDYTYPIVFHELHADESRIILETDAYTVSTIILEHRMPCTGFLFQEKPADRKMIGTKIEAYQIPYTQIPGIKKGANFTLPNGTIIPNNELTLPPPAPVSYAYCSDTAYTESILPIIQNATLLYHEATYLEDMKSVAKERGHATAKEAATIAQKANVGQLIIGHFSSRYHDLNPFLQEAQTIFANTALAEEGTVFEVG